MASNPYDSPAYALECIYSVAETARMRLAAGLLTEPAIDAALAEIEKLTDGALSEKIKLWAYSATGNLHDIVSFINASGLCDVGRIVSINAHAGYSMMVMEVPENWNADEYFKQRLEAKKGRA